MVGVESITDTPDLLSPSSPIVPTMSPLPPPPHAELDDVVPAPEYDSTEAHRNTQKSMGS